MLISRHLIIRLVGVVLLLSIFSGVGYYRLFIWPHRNFQKVIESSDSTDDEIREAIHQVIAWSESHDGFLILGAIGDETSVAFLIRSLERLPEEKRRSGCVMCTWEHCKDALISITGEDFGYDVERWKAWHRKQ